MKESGEFIMTERHALVPEYMQRFQCIGGACEDTCCSFWKVSVDKRTYTNYMNIPDRKWRQRFKEKIKKTTIDVTDHNHAVLGLKASDGSCTMLLDDGLCSIQADLGEEYLCSTCATYPRVVNEVDGVQEVSASPSCPEAARMILLEPKGISFQEVEPLLAKNILKVRSVSSDGSPLTAFFWDLRIAAIEVLQRREFVLPHRILLVGWLCDHIVSVTKSGDFSNVKAEIEWFKDQLNTNAELRDYNVFPTNSDIQLKFLNKIVMDRVERVVWNVRYNECLHEYISGMTSEGDDQDSIKNNYSKAYLEYYSPYMKDHEYVLENYIINAIYHTLFPLSVGKNVFDQFIMIVLNYALIKMHLIGISAYHKGLTDEIVVKLIQSYSKNYEHAPSFIQDVYSQLKKEKYDTLGHLSLLIKNAGIA